jgi:Skp family chaperone for outer membrane proteins
MSARSGGFSTGQRRLLAICAAVIVLGGGVLLVDELFIREAPLSLQDALPAVAERLGLALSFDSPDAGLLAERLAALPELGVPAARIGPVLSRADSAHRLWLFEFGVDETLLVSAQPQGGARRHSGELQRLGMIVQLPRAELPRWVQDSAPAPTPPWTAEALARLGRIEDLQIATDGEFVVAVARPGAFGLYELTARQRSPEFYPGLLNSALPIDAQRVLDLTALLMPERPALPRLNRIDVQVRLPEIRPPNISAHVEKVQAEQRAEMDALRSQMEAERETMRAQMEAERKARSARLDAEREALRARLAADREALNTKLAERSAQQREQFQQRMRDASEGESEHAPQPAPADAAEGTTSEPDPEREQ